MKTICLRKNFSEDWMKSMEHKVVVKRQVFNKIDGMGYYCIAQYGHYAMYQKLKDELLRMIDMIESHPFLFPKRWGSIRKSVLKYGYVLYYYVEDSTIYVDYIRSSKENEMVN